MSSDSRLPYTQGTALPRQRGPEFYLAIIAAALVLLGLVFASRVTIIFDLSRFRQAVTKFFDVSVRPPPREFPAARYSAEGAAAERARLLSEAKSRLFNTPPEARRDRPGFERAPVGAIPLKAHELPVPARRPRPREDLRQEEAVEGLDALSDRLPVVARREGRSDPSVTLPDLAALYGTGREGGGGPGRPGADRSKPLFTPLPPPPKPDVQPRETAPLAATERHRLEEAPPVLQALVDQRPPGGYPSLDDEVEADFTVYREPGSDDVYFRLAVGLRPEAELPVIAKDVLFLIDVSHSIGGEELNVVRQAVLQVLAGLPAEDRWNLAVFSEEARFYSEGFLPADEFPARREAVAEYINRRRSDRMTNVFDATQELLRALPRSPRPCNVFLVSDGKANAGTAEVRRITEDFRRIKRQGFAIFTFNAGPGGNRYLLQLLAYRSRGVHLDAPALETAGGALVGFADLVDRPVLVNTLVHYTNLQPDEVHPQVLPNLYVDKPVVVYGRSAAGKTVTMRVAGVGAGGPREFFFRTTVPAADAAHPEVARQWAQGKAHALMARLAEDPENDALRQEIIALAEKYDLPSTLEMVRPRGLFGPLRDFFKRD